MSTKEMQLPKEYSFSCTPIVNHDGRVVRPDYVKFGEYYCSECGHIQAPTHGVTENYCDTMVQAYNQSGPCPECGAENAWAWRRIEKLGETETVLKVLEGANDKAASAGSGAAAGGADLTHA